MELCSDLICIYSAVPNNGGGRGLIKMGEGGLTDNLNINKQGVQIREGGLKIVLGQKWQHVTTNYGDCFG